MFRHRNRGRSQWGVTWEKPLQDLHNGEAQWMQQSRRLR